MVETNKIPKRFNHVLLFRNITPRLNDALKWLLIVHQQMNK